MLEKTKKYLKTDLKDLNREDIGNLQDIINYHSDLYYNREKPIISDYEYDILLKKLDLLEDKYLISDKTSSKVWSEVKESSFEKVRHSRVMISLDNTYNENELKEFDVRVKKILWMDLKSQVEYTIEFKFDWLWIELIYENWKYVKAITRWNWIEWEDVTENVRMINNIPKTISYKEKIEVRWEVVMPISSFDKINKEALIKWTKIFSNARNAASWSIRTIDTTITKDRNLKYFWYDLANFSEFTKSNNISEYFKVIKSIDELWFETSSYFKKCKSIIEVIACINDFWDLKKTLDFDIDWLVIKVNNIEYWSKIWSTQHHPRYAIAYKFPAEILTTKLLDVEHQVWRTWTLTPVAHLEPVNIWWVIVKRATLHNYDEIKKLDIKIGDYIFIKRAWEVIPKVISVIKELRTWDEISIKIPSKCPSCNTSIINDIWKVRYYCPNTNNCLAQIEERLSYSVWKDWLNIDWLWEKQVKLFLNKWLIKNLVDVFYLKDKREELLSLDWFKEKSVNNLLLSIEKARDIDIKSFIVSLWIPWVGKKTAKELSKVILDNNWLVNFGLQVEDLEDLNDIWVEIAKEVYNYFNNENNKYILSQLINILNIVYLKPINNKIKSIFSWKKVCITWSFDWFKRGELASMLENKWGEFMSSVSSKTDFLLAWDKSGSKLKKANELWVEVIDINNFLSLINE